MNLAKHNAVLAVVANEAATRNGEVVLALFREQPFRCDKCKWSLSVKQFAVILMEYTRLKIMLHHCMQRPSSVDPFVLGNKVRELQSRLSPMRPCEDCTKRFNPTKRIKYGEPSFPEVKPPLEYLYV